MEFEPALQAAQEAYLGFVEQVVEFVEGALDHCHTAPVTTSCIRKDLLWQRPIHTHIAEMAVVNGIAVLAGILGWARMKRERGWPQADPKARGPLTSRVVDVAIAVLLIYFFAVQCWFKAYRNDGFVHFFGFEVHRALVWMVMPCHIWTLLAAWALLFNSRLMASLCVTLAWNTFLGSAFADFTDQVHWGEAPAFIVHHAFINVLPFYFATSFQLHRFTVGWLCWTSSLMTLWNMAVHMPLSYYSGYNINYHVHPPAHGLPNEVFGKDVNYKPKIILVLVLLSTMSHIIIGGAGLALRGLLEGKKKKEE
ncbi:TMEM164 family protein [Diplonema papillatum]|nr:TMEM164 family protein [Diplonema papillatum]